MTALGTFASTGVAAACPSSPAGTPFTSWGDNNSYFLLPGGSFEGAPGWRLLGARLTSGNEPFYVNSSSDGQSLLLDGGGKAISPPFCLDDTMTQLRFFADETAPGSDLNVELVVWNGENRLTYSVADLADGSTPAWKPTDPLSLAAVNIPSGESLTAQLALELPGGAGTWQVDDVYMDPYRTG